MNDRELSRRDFLAAAAALTAASSGGPKLIAQSTADAPIEKRVSKVVQISSDHVVRGRVTRKPLLDDLLDLSLRTALGMETAGDAWRSVLRADDLIGLKFNSSAAGALGVSDPFADALIESLVQAGFERRQIVPIEAPEGVYERHGVVRPAYGWSDEPVDFGSGADQTALLLDQVTAIVNVPFLKTHNIAGMTCCLKNLSHALVKHPARFHGGHCSPYVGDIVAMPKIRRKLRIHVVNALRVVFDRGPDARDDYTWDAGAIIAGVDPVAVDSVGLDLINSQRLVAGLPVINRDDPVIKHIRAARDRGLGVLDRRLIDVSKLRI